MFGLSKLDQNNKSKIQINKPSSATKFCTLSLLCMSIVGFNPSYAASVNTDKFDALFYVKYAPQTLYDMLQNTPGANSLLIELERSSQSRGFGSSGDQILINSQRLSGKANSIDKELENIQARDVDYIEVIRGTNSDLAVQSKGIVVNVILKETNDNSLLWTIGAEKVDYQSPKFMGSAFLSARDGGLKYRVGLAQEASPYSVIRDEKHQLANGQQSLASKYVEVRDLITRRANGKVEYQLSTNTDIQINALYEKFYMDRTVDKSTSFLLTNSEKFDSTLYDYDRDKWEIGGDVNVKLSDHNEFRLLFISNETDALEQLWFNSAETKQGQSLVYQLPREYVTSENILRSNWKYTLNDNHSFDSGVELAINKRNEELELIREMSNYHSVEANDIKETRYEAFINYNYTISADLNLQSSLIYEKSTMEVDTQIQITGDNTSQVQDGSSRTFNYLKPRVNLRYDLSDIYQLRLNYEKTVSQLSLHDFVPWYNQFEERLEQVNPNLKPEERDEYSITLERKWQETAGSISLSPYYHNISELITEIPLGERSSNGNLHSAKEYGVSLKTNFGLDYFGFNNTLISASYTWRDSEMTDPFTGEKTPIERTAQNLWDLKINQNEVLPGLSFSASLSNKTPYIFNYYSYRGKLTSDLTLNAYVDYKINEQFKLRLSGEELLNQKYTVYKDRYQGNVATTDFLRHEARENEFSPEIALTLTGQF